MVLLNKHRLADWSKAPEWAQFHVIEPDGNGYWCAFKHGTMWYADFNESGKFNLKDIDCAETLESRPDQELPDGVTALVEELQTLRRRLSNKGKLQSDPEVELLEKSLLDSHYEHADLFDENKMLKAALKTTQAENARLHERLNRLTLDRINSEERHDPI